MKATCVIHTPNRAEPCCDRHARHLVGVMAALGVHVVSTLPVDADECGNCRNETKACEGAGWADLDSVAVMGVDPGGPYDPLGIKRASPVPDHVALLCEAYDFGQFDDDFDQPLAKPIRAALRQLIRETQTEDGKPLAVRIAELESRIISVAYVDEIPTFRQGAPAHEVEEDLTAADVKAWVDRLASNSDVKKMVNAFLCWPMPQSFAPDGGIRFDRMVNGQARKDLPGYWPIGTNLFNADEARQMIEHLLSVAAKK